VAEPFGVHLNNFLGEEDINPRGWHRQVPGDRLTTMMTPTLVLRAGRPCLALGTGGSSRIRSAILQVLLALLAAGRSPAEAVAAPRIHAEASRIWMEPGLVAGEALVRAWPGAVVFPSPDRFFGGVHVAADLGAPTGAGDARRGGAVARTSIPRSPE